MTHYKADEELAEHIREDSGYQSFKTTTTATTDGAGNSHVHAETVQIRESPPSTANSSLSDTSTIYTHTETKGPLLHTAHPVVLAADKGLAHDIVHNAQSGFKASATHVTTGEHQEVYETPELREKRLKDEAKYRDEQEKIATKHDKNLEKITDEYRKKTEHEAEKIRHELEKQYKRDLDYRQEVVNESVKRQKQELELEVKFAKKELEHERALAKEALEHSRTTTDVEVNLDTSAGHTVSVGHEDDEDYD